MARYEGTSAAAYIAANCLNNMASMASYVYDQNDDAVFAMRSAIQQGFLDLLHNGITYEVRTGDTLRFQYADFVLPIIFADEEHVNLAGSEARWVDVYNAQGEYITRLDLVQHSAHMKKKALDALSDAPRQRRTRN